MDCKIFAPTTMVITNTSHIKTDKRDVANIARCLAFHTFVLRQGKKFEGGKTYWTITHMKWLKSLELKGLDKETLSEYLVTYEYLTEKIERLDNRIEELASGDKYKEKVKNMGCFLGIKIHTALSMVVEIGDFNRFEKAPKYAGFIGLVPSENSSGDSTNRYSITKAEIVILDD